ncbi:hypothetical protein D3C75_938480 [compost metagenome]
MLLQMGTAVLRRVAKLFIQLIQLIQYTCIIRLAGKSLLHRDKRRYCVPFFVEIGECQIPVDRREIVPDGT